MNIPESMPTLSAGGHHPNSGEACLMEYVSLLAGEEWSESPACTHPVLAGSARATNDQMSDANRHLLVPLIGRLFGTSELGMSLERQILSVRLEVFAARSVLHLVPDEGQAEAAIKAAESWTDDPCEATLDAACAAAYDVASLNWLVVHSSSAAMYGAGAAYAAAVATEATYEDADEDADAATYAAYAVKWAVNVNDRDRALVDGLTALIDEYDRLTGRTTWHELSPTELADLAQAGACSEA